MSEGSLRSDRAMNIKAARAEYLDRMTIVGENRAHAHRYEPTPPEILDDMLLEVREDLSAYTFVDVGSGKGRVLCLAAQHPFRRIIGVEFAVELHRSAEENLRRFRARSERAIDVRSILIDATAFEWPRDPLVVFLFNPFGPEVLTRVADKLATSHAAHPRSIYVLYYMPEHADRIDRAGFEKFASAKNWSIYRVGW